jgi:hypothetical protein
MGAHDASRLPVRLAISGSGAGSSKQYCGKVHAFILLKMGAEGESMGMIEADLYVQHPTSLVHPLLQPNTTVIPRQEVACVERRAKKAAKILLYEMI